MDADGDGFGGGTDSVIACFAPEAYVASDKDCDDADDAVYPGAPDDTCVQWTTTAMARRTKMPPAPLVQGHGQR